ncbi:MAG: DMT family transporter [Dongiaceae bacterium]
MLVSESLAIAAALCFALSSMMISELRGGVPLLQLARWQMLATFVMTGALSLALGGWRTVGPWQLGLLAASSVVGIAIASTTYFATIYAVGPRITALLFSLTAPFALALGYLVLGETIDRRQGLGVVLVLGGVVLAIGVPRRLRRPGRGAPAMTAAAAATPALGTPPLEGRLRLGIALGVTTALGQAVGTLLARPAMAAGVEPFTAMALRSGLAASIFVALSAVSVGSGSRAPVRPGALALVLGSAFVGTSLGMSLLMAALHQGNAGLVATLSSMTPVLVLPLVWVRSRRRPSAAAWIGAALAIAGTGLISIR